MVPTILSVLCHQELFNLQITSHMTPSQKHRMKTTKVKPGNCFWL